MIRSLAITNLAVIESVSVHFEQAFNVLTGETGAGKSMLVGAVGLLIGGRASADLVRTGAELATIEAVFESADRRTVVVRREVSAQGRSRAFVDGQLTTSAALRPLVSQFIELHGQHEHQLLLDPLTHLPLVDAWAGLDHEAAAVRDRWDEVQAAERALERAAMDAGERAARLELVEFHLAELEKAQLVAGEDESLAQTRDVLRHAGRLTALCRESYGLLYDDEAAVLGRLGQVWKRVSELAAIDPAFGPYLAARDDVKAQLEDLALSLRDYEQKLDASPERLQATEDRLALIERLKRKHGPTLDDVLARTAALTQERAALDAGPAGREAAEATAAAARQRFLAAAQRLSSARRAAAPRFAAAMEHELGELAMAGTRFELRLETEDAPVGVARRRHRPRRVLPRTQPRRDAAAAGPHRLGRRAVAGDARLQDAQRRRPAAAHHGVRRGGCRHRRAHRRGGGGEAAPAGRGDPGPVHHPPPADRRPGGDAVRHHQAGPRVEDGHHRRSARRRRAGAGNCEDDGRGGRPHGRTAGRGTDPAGAGESRPAGGESERRKSPRAKAKGR